MRAPAASEAARVPIDLAPERQLRPRRIPLFFGFALYGFVAGVALIFVRFTGREEFAAMLRDAPLLPALGIGVAAGVVLGSLTGWMTKRWEGARELEEEFAHFAADHRWWEIVLLAAMSATAEEFFFRGALMIQLVASLGGVFGPLVATLAFAALHWPIQGRMRLWPVFAFVAGLVFWAELRLTGSLWAPIATHAVVNGINLLRIRLKYRWA